MKKILFALALMISIFSCSDSEEETIINFSLEYEGQPFVFFQDYTYPDGKIFNLTRLSFYISEFNFPNEINIYGDNPVYIDLTNSHADASSAAQGYDLNLGDIGSLDNVDHFSFKIGVNETLNATTPEEYSSDNDLSRSGEYWSGWNSFVFCKIEGNIDLDGDQIKETGVSLHLGSDAALREISLNGIENSEINLLLDVKDIFQNGSDIFDITSTNRIHNLSQIDQINELMNNLAAAIKIKN